MLAGEGAAHDRWTVLKRRVCSERGVALVISLMAICFIMALGGALMLSTATETRIADQLPEQVGGALRGRRRP